MSFVLCAVVFTKLPISTAYLAFYLGVLAGSYVIGSYMHHENLTSIKVVSLVLACTGMMFALGVSTVSVADISFVGGSALAGVLTSLWNILNKNIGDNYSPLELNMYDFIIGLFFTGAVSIMLGERWANPQVNAPWLANLTIGAILICTGWLIPYAYRRIEAQIGSVVGQLEIVFGIIFGAVLLHETVEIRSIIGCLLILTAGLLPYASGQLGRRQIRKQ